MKTDICIRSYSIILESLQIDYQKNRTRFAHSILLQECEIVYYLTITLNAAALFGFTTYTPGFKPVSVFEVFERTSATFVPLMA